MTHGATEGPWTVEDRDSRRCRVAVACTDCRARTAELGAVHGRGGPAAGVVLRIVPMLAQQTGARARIGGVCVAMWICGCEPGPEGCVGVEGPGLWDAPPSGRLCVLGDLVVTGRKAEELAALERVEEIAGSLVVHDNPDLKQLPGLPALARIGGVLSISANARLTGIGGFPNLAAVEGGVYVAENLELVDFDLGGPVETTGSVFFGLNPRLKQITGMTALTRVERDLYVGANAVLEALEFPALAGIEGDLNVSHNPALRGVVFPALREVTGAWSVVGNPALESLAGFAPLERVGSASIADNAALAEVVWSDAFEARSTLEIVDNERLERIAGHPAVRLPATARVTIARNAALRDIEGFAGVVFLGELEIEENMTLLEISGWSALIGVGGGGLTIARNPALTGPGGWFSALETASDVAIFGNSSLEPEVVDSMLGHVEVEGATRVGDNKGESTLLDPCPWPRDGVCDGTTGKYGPGTGLCLLDWEDCA